MTHIVITAAGRGSRLKSIVPEYYKPLVLLNGRPLIRTLVEISLSETQHDASRVTVVVSPLNAKPISDVLPHDINFVLQPEPVGLPDAILRGVATSREPDTLVICGDNIVSLPDLQLVMNKLREQPGLRSVVATRAFFNDDDAARYTLINTTRDGPMFWRPQSPNELAQPAWRGRAGDDPWLAWIGPIGVPTELWQRFLSRHTMIETALNDIHHAYPFHCVPTSCIDVGVPAELPE